MIGYQPTLPAPPVSTIYGLISAARGEPTGPADTFVAFSFTSKGNFVDLEKILEVEPGKGGKTNVIKREVLTDAELYLYISPDFRDAFERPHYQLVLGRSSDLATVEEVKDVELEEVDSSSKSYFGRGLYTNPPFGYRIATMYSLPVYFTDTIPRQAVGTRRFFVIEERYSGEGSGYVDPGLSDKSACAMELFSEESLGLG